MRKYISDGVFIHFIKIRCSECKKISQRTRESNRSSLYYKNHSPGLKKCSFCKNTRGNILLVHKDIIKKPRKITRY